MIISFPTAAAAMRRMTVWWCVCERLCVAVRRAMASALFTRPSSRCRVEC